MHQNRVRETRKERRGPLGNWDWGGTRLEALICELRDGVGFAENTEI